MTSFKVSYVSSFPTKGDSPSLKIFSDPKDVFLVKFINKDNGEVVLSDYFNGNQIIFGRKQWFINWKIEVYDKNNNLLFYDDFSLKDRVAFIKMDAVALGDNIAWIPYVEEFRKKHNCKVICSTFFNHLFEDAYPEIMFVQPNIKISNVYAQYYIGSNEEDNNFYSPVNSKFVPLQKVASSILGLEHREIRPKISTNYTPKSKNKKYVCISEFASHPKKHWKEVGGWQKVVDSLIKEGYEVISISKEETNLKGVISKNGDISLNDRISDILGADFFVGVSSGLSWLSWAVGTHVFLISDVTPSWHEFKSGVTRIMHEPKNKVDYSETFPVSSDVIIETIKKRIKKNN